jgi:hypothetical protein
VAPTHHIRSPLCLPSWHACWSWYPQAQAYLSWPRPHPSCTFPTTHLLIYLHSRTHSALHPSTQPPNPTTTQRSSKPPTTLTPPPPLLCPPCRDLLAKILVADPAKRITVKGIYDHPWYNKYLPAGVKEMNDRTPPPPEGMQVCR